MLALVIAYDLQANKPRNSIIRYLKTIVACTEAVESLTAKDFSSPITAHVLTIPNPPIDCIDHHLAVFKADILNNPAFAEAERIRARDLLDHPSSFSVTSAERATVHPEAVMMALSRSFHTGDVAKESQEALSLGDESCSALEDVFQVRVCLRVRLLSSPLHR